MISGSAIFPELVTGTFIGIGPSNFFHADTPDPTTLIYPLNLRTFPAISIEDTYENT